MAQLYQTSAHQTGGEYAECMRSVCGLYPVSPGYAGGMLEDYTGDQYTPSALSVHYQCSTGTLNWFAA